MVESSGSSKTVRESFREGCNIENAGVILENGNARDQVSCNLDWMQYNQSPVVSLYDNKTPRYYSNCNQIVAGTVRFFDSFNPVKDPILSLQTQNFGEITVKRELNDQKIDAEILDEFFERKAVEEDFRMAGSHAGSILALAGTTRVAVAMSVSSDTGKESVCNSTAGLDITATSTACNLKEESQPATTKSSFVALELENKMPVHGTLHGCTTYFTDGQDFGKLQKGETHEDSPLDHSVQITWEQGSCITTPMSVQSLLLPSSVNHFPQTLSGVTKTSTTKVRSDAPCSEFSKVNPDCQVTQVRDTSGNFQRVAPNFQEHDVCGRRTAPVGVDVGNMVNVNMDTTGRVFLNESCPEVHANEGSRRSSCAQFPDDLGNESKCFQTNKTRDDGEAKSCLKTGGEDKTRRLRMQLESLEYFEPLEEGCAPLVSRLLADLLKAVENFKMLIDKYHQLQDRLRESEQQTGLSIQMLRNTQRELKQKEKKVSEMKVRLASVEARERMRNDELKSQRQILTYKDMLQKANDQLKHKPHDHSLSGRNGWEIRVSSLTGCEDSSDENRLRQNTMSIHNQREVNDVGNILAQNVESHDGGSCQLVNTVIEAKGQEISRLQARNDELNIMHQTIEGQRKKFGSTKGTGRIISRRRRIMRMKEYSRNAEGNIGVLRVLSGVKKRYARAAVPLRLRMTSGVNNISEQIRLKKQIFLLKGQLETSREEHSEVSLEIGQWISRVKAAEEEIETLREKRITQDEGKMSLLTTEMTELNDDEERIPQDDLIISLRQQLEKEKACSNNRLLAVQHLDKFCSEVQVEVQALLKNKDKLQQECDNQNVILLHVENICQVPEQNTLLGGQNQLANMIDGDLKRLINAVKRKSTKTERINSSEKEDGATSNTGTDIQSEYILRITNYEAEKTEMQRNLDAANKLVQTLRLNVVEQRLESEQQQQNFYIKLADQEKENKQLREKLNKVTEDANEAYAKVVSSDVVIENLRKKLDEKSDFVSMSEHQELQKLAKKSEDTVQQLRQDCEMARQQLKELAVMYEENMTLKKRLEEEIQKQLQLKVENERLQRSHREIQEQTAKAEELCAHLTLQHGDIVAKEAATLKRAHDAEQELSSLRRECAASVAQCDAAEQEYANLLKKFEFLTEHLNSRAEEESAAALAKGAGEKFIGKAQLPQGICVSESYNGGPTLLSGNREFSQNSGLIRNAFSDFKWALADEKEYPLQQKAPSPKF